MMSRNLNRRVEVLFPIHDKALIRRLKVDILQTYLADSVKRRRMKSDGLYVRVPQNGKRPINSQERLIERARASTR